jgi:hypothetical protein
VRAPGAVGAAISANTGVEKQIIGGGASHRGGGVFHGGSGGANSKGGLRRARRLVASMPWKEGRGFPIACQRLSFEGKFH